VDEILDGQTDIFELLGTHELEKQSPPTIEKTGQPSAEENKL